jgi:Ca-activated chloride channel family protein
MQRNVGKDASASAFRASDVQKSGWENMKSPRKITIHTIALALLAANVILLSPITSPAQDPNAPAAPVPKVPTDSATHPPPNPQEAQIPANQQNPTDSQTTLKFAVNYVFLPVTVKDGEGHLVADLTRNEFRIIDDNVEQRVEFFSAEAFPLSVVILLDNDLKSKDAEQVESSLSSIIAGLSASDEAFVCRFDTNFHPGKGFTRDQDKLLTELHRTRLSTDRPDVAPPDAGGPYSGPTINGQSAVSPGAPPAAPTTMILGEKSNKALDDAVFEAAQLLKDRGRDRRKMIFLISDGDNGKGNHNTYGNTVKDLLRYGVSVYSLGVGGGFYERKYSRLQSYSHDTGGDVFYAAKRNSLEDLYSRVTEQARNQYTLGYNPRGNDRSKDYHTVEVRVRREGLSILTREGYYSVTSPR